jgi:hypothetical protein
MAKKQRIVIEVAFEQWQKVYLITDPDQHVRLVSGYFVRCDGTVLYQLTCGTEADEHNEEEISTEKTII